ncbi:MAG: cellulase family glycosylhydrolase [Kiritimatiellia bacterium]|jgi:hypothetical protein
MNKFAISLSHLTCGAVMAVAFGAAHVGAAAGPAAPLPSPTIPDVMGVQLKNGPDWTRKRLEEAQAMGFRIVRKGMYWGSVEKTRGVYDFSDYDEQMACAKQLDLTVVVTLFGGNALFEKKEGVRGVVTEEGRQGFARFAAAAAARYKGQKVLFEIWNEPNVRTFWGSHGTHNTKPFADEYSALVNVVVPAMLEADPDCFVLAGSVSNYWEPSYQWTEFCFQNGVLKSGIRGWSVHPYGVRTPEEHAIGHARTRELLVKHGAPDLPIVNTERGYSVAKTETGEGWSGGEAGRTLGHQASQFVRQLLVDQLCGVRFSVWYEWGGNENFGFWNPDGSPRPVVASIRQLIEELGGYRVVRRLESDSKLDYLLLCENANGARKLAAWTAPPPGGSPDEAWEHEAALDLGAGVKPLALKLGAHPAYIALPPGAKPGKSVTTTPRPVPEAVAVATPAGGVDLKVFEEGRSWTFTKNTGDGSFTLGRDADGTPIGILSYDFTKSKSKTTPYVIASTTLDAVGPCDALTFFARAPLAQQLTFRVVDSTGQTLQFKTRVKGTGGWEPIRFPLDRRLERWDGANDGYAHFPLKALLFSVPKPGGTLVGKVEYAGFSAVGSGASARPAPAQAPAVAAPGSADPAAAAPAAGGGMTVKLYDAKTGELAMTGVVEGASAPAAPSSASASASAPALAPAAVPVETLPPGGMALKLFDGDVAWNFVKNTGEGSFTLTKDPEGRGVGVMAYDFSKSKARSTPYVLASAPVSIPGGTQITMQVRTAIPQRLTFRVVDSTGQTLQYKTKTVGQGAWETVRFPLDRKLERWDGANDGFVHFPIKSVVFSVPQPAGVSRGAVEYAEAVAR